MLNFLTGQVQVHVLVHAMANRNDESLHNEVDAAHPRFIKTPTDSEIKEYNEKSNYYCAVCDIYLAPDLESLQKHFQLYKDKHNSFKSCLYCKQLICEYFFQKESRTFHKCKFRTKPEL